LEFDGPATPECTGVAIRYQIDDEHVLEYGQSWERQGIVCTAEETGLTCENDAGAGLFLSRAQWDSW
jgi:hypothetical protein